MNSDINTGEVGGSGAKLDLGSIRLTQDEVRAMRRSLHELANVFTGVMIAGDLLSLRLAEEASLRLYAEDICAGTTRGCTLVRELRSQLLAACGETELAPLRGASAAE